MFRSRRSASISTVVAMAALFALLPTQALAVPPSNGSSAPVSLVPIPADPTATMSAAAVEAHQTPMTAGVPSVPTAELPPVGDTTAPASATGTVDFSTVTGASAAGAVSAVPAVYVQPSTQQTAGVRAVAAQAVDTGTPVQATGTPVSLGKATAANAPTPQGVWQVQVNDQSAGPAADVDGPVVSVTPPDTGATPVDVVLDYSKFQDLYGADWGDHLTWVQLPACYLTTPDTDGCDDATPLDTTNDPATHTISANVDPTATVAGASAHTAARTAGGVYPASYVTPASSTATPTVLAAVGSTAGPTGNFAASPLDQTGRWNAGGSSGGFQWSYGLKVPAAPAGPAPKISFSYSSQAVDGRTSSASGQVSMIGEGWTYEPGHIERRYRSCTQDRDPIKDSNGVDQAANNATHKTGDLCWGSDNAVMTLNGSTTALVKDDKTGVWHPEGDDGTLITHTESGTGADTGEWIVTTRDGTRYHFGKNTITGHADTNSVGSVPVFGNHPGEPCHQSDFASSSCTQNWFWGLDYVEDPRGNAMIIDYATATNYYARNNKFAHPVAYTRDVHPVKIEYGLRTDNLGATAQYYVSFDDEQRCLESDDTCTAANLRSKDPGKHNYWYDTPANLICASTAKYCPTSPSFFTEYRLAGVTTYAPREDGVTRKVDSWALKQAFPQTWYETAPSLWLSGITRTGYRSDGTGDSLPTIGFAPATGYIPAGGSTVVNTPLPNRVSNGATDPRPGYARPRIGQIVTGTGEDINVTYTGGCATRPADSTAATNHLLCFPDHWSPGGDKDNPPLEWFNKYLVDNVTEVDATGSDHSDTMVTHYDYNGTPAWAKDDDEFTKGSQRTYSQWRGYASVTVRKGADGSANQTAKTSTYFRGLGSQAADGSCTADVKDYYNRVSLGCDLPAFAGMTAETVIFAGSAGPRVVQSRQLTFPTATLTASRAREGDTPLEARRVTVVRTDTEQTVSTGTSTLRTDTTFDGDGMPTSVQTSVVQADGTGAVTSTGDFQCSNTSYAKNAGANLVGLPAEVRATATDCAHNATASSDQLISDTRTFYDASAASPFLSCTQTPVTPTAGLATDVCTIDGNGTSWLHSVSTTYDALGRAHVVTDVKGHTTTTDYTPATGAATSVKTTNTMGWATTTTVDPGRGTTLTTTDPNNRVTTSVFDGLGRLIEGYDAAHSGTGTPVVKYTYQAVGGTNEQPYVETSTLKDDGSYKDTYTLDDGMLRTVQVQAPAVGGGRIVSDTYYNDQGLTRLTNNGYLAQGDAGSELFVPDSDFTIPNSTRTSYDGMQRPVTSAVWWDGAEHARTTTAYTGDTTTVTPPAGGTITRTTTDTRGHTVELDQFTTSAGTSGAFTRTSYTYDGRGLQTKVTDTKGNEWDFHYDARGRVTDQSDPDSGTTSFTYDSLDRQLTVKDAQGQITYNAWDPLSRKLRIQADSSTGTTLASWQYDTLPDGTHLYGQLLGSTRFVGTDQYVTRLTGADADYRPTGRDIVIPDNANTKGLSGTYHYGYTYTPTGKLLATDLPAAGQLSAEKLITRYNQDGLAESTSGLNWYTSDTTYSPYGEVLRSVTGEAPYRVWTTNLIDHASGRLDEQVTDREDTTSHRLHDTTYAYDLVGNPTAIDDTYLGSADNQCFRYDYVGELTEAWTSTAAACSTTVTNGTTGADPSTVATGSNAYWDSYSFDELGNRKQLVQHQVVGGVDATKDATYSYTYGNADGTQPHALTKLDATVPGSPSASGSNTYSYDPSGNTHLRTIAGDTQTLNWNREGRIDSVSGFGTGAGAITLAPVAGTTKCLDIQSSGTTDGTPVQIYSCNGTGAQQWTQTGGALKALGKCLQDVGTGVAGDLLQMFTCSGAANQTWQKQSDGTYLNPATGKCIADPASSSTDGTDLQLAACASGTTGQTWTVNTGTSYIYDADGNRLLTIDATMTTLTLGEAELRADHNGAVKFSARYYSQAGTPTVVRTLIGGYQQLHALLTDRNGTATTAVYLAAGMSSQYRRTLPYGEDRGQEPTAWPGREGFVGGNDETTTGLIHLGARDYDPATGRFVSADPIVAFTDPLQMNGYSYANGNPVGASDPTGKMYEAGDGYGMHPVDPAPWVIVPDYNLVRLDTVDQRPATKGMSQYMRQAAVSGQFELAMKAVNDYLNTQNDNGGRGRSNFTIVLSSVMVAMPGDGDVARTVAFVSSQGLTGKAKALLASLQDMNIAVYKADKKVLAGHAEGAAAYFRDNAERQEKDLGGLIEKVGDTFSSVLICKKTEGGCATALNHWIGDGANLQVGDAGYVNGVRLDKKNIGVIRKEYGEDGKGRFNDVVTTWVEAGAPDMSGFDRFADGYNNPEAGGGGMSSSENDDEG